MAAVSTPSLNNTSFQSPMSLKRMRAQSQLPALQTLPPVEPSFFECWSPLRVVRRRSSKKSTPSTPSPKPPYQSRFFEHLPGSVPPDLRGPPKPKLLRHASAPTVARSRPRPRHAPSSFAKVDEEEPEAHAVAVSNEHAPLSEQAVNRAARSGSLTAEVAAQKQALQKLKELRDEQAQMSDTSIASTVSIYNSPSQPELASVPKEKDPAQVAVELASRGVGRIRRATLVLAQRIRPTENNHETA